VDFFGLQDKARRASLALLAAFATAMLVFGWIVAKATLLVATLVGYGYKSINPEPIQIIMVSLVWGFVLYRCFTRYRDINHGGEILASQFGAEKIMDRDAQGEERILMNVVHEMAIAASLPPLPCYVLRDEPDINAFVLGRYDNPALVVTQGTINQLDREELSGVMAHEYAHISNQDLKLNMRMLVALGGLNAIDEIGLAMIMHSKDSTVGRTRGRFSATGSRHPGGDAILFVAGCLVRLLGSTLVLFGDIIKAAFSRKRELLADAKAVQFTRESWGLASVLDKVSGDPKRPALKSEFAGELEHLCLSGPWRHALFSSWLATHPDPHERVALIEPHFSAKLRGIQRRKKTEASSNGAGSSGGSVSVVPINIAQDYVAPTIGELGNELAIVLSMMVVVAGYNRETSTKNFKKIMKCYTDKEFPLRIASEPGFKAEFESALNKLLQQSPYQRQALIDHLAEMMDHDDVRTPEEEKMFNYIASRLNPPAQTG